MLALNVKHGFNNFFKHCQPWPNTGMFRAKIMIMLLQGRVGFLKERFKNRRNLIFIQELLYKENKFSSLGIAWDQPDTPT